MKYCTFFLFILCSMDLSARLRATPFNNLLEKSSIIVLAQSKEIKIIGAYAGEAKLKVLDVAKGQYTSEYITVHWTSEVHDQKIYEANKRYVLFLKANDKGQYVGSSYGRSFWPIEYVRGSKGKRIGVIKMDEYPLDNVSHTPKNITDFVPANACDEIGSDKYRRIKLKSLLQYIKG